MRPLSGITVVELGGIGPGPFAGMMLADLGAEVIRIDPPGGMGAAEAGAHTVLLRGRKSVWLDLKLPGAREVVLALCERADAVIEGFRPGVAERLGLGPDDALERNPALVYGRMTGWGQDGPLASAAGHDINYIALAGALRSLVSTDGTPVPPLNLLGDFGGGGMLLAVGMLAALLNVQRGGAGQVVDAAVLDGSALLMAMHQSMTGSGMWGAAPGQNLFDGGAPFYAVYPTVDGNFMAVGAIEPQFYARLVRGLEVDVDLRAQHDPRTWPATREIFAARFAQRTRAEWADLFEGIDACVTPVLSPSEAAQHPHLSARAVYGPGPGAPQPAPAPRFSDMPLPANAAPSPGADTADVLAWAGLSPEQVAALQSD